MSYCYLTIIEKEPSPKKNYRNWCKFQTFYIHPCLAVHSAQRDLGIVKLIQKALEKAGFFLLFPHHIEACSYIPVIFIKFVHFHIFIDTICFGEIIFLYFVPGVPFLWGKIWSIRPCPKHRTVHKSLNCKGCSLGS